MKLRFLGTGDSGGVPLFGCDCQICQQARSGTGRRRPCSALLSFGDSSILIDAGRTDLAALIEQHDIHRILLTHYHVDHVQGLFHLRWGKKGASIAVNGPHDEQGCADLLKHPGILDFSDYMEPFKTRNFDKLSVTPVLLNHSKQTLGYCFEYQNKRLAYLTDTIGLPQETASFLMTWQPTTLILDCTHAPDSPKSANHNNVASALAIHFQISPEQTWLTHISHDLDKFWYLDGIDFPSSVHVANDGNILVCST